jgi:hypothetical protein
VRLHFDYDSGGPGGRGAWVLVLLALIAGTVIITILTLGQR